MERQFEIRKLELIAECKVDPGVCEGALERLEEFAQPFLSWLTRREQREYGRTYLAGLVSNVETKNVESIAYLHDQERHRLQAFVGQSKWEHQPLLDELAIQVGQMIGEPDGVLVFDPSGFHKSGAHSVGVQRQWCGRLGKIDNCQVAVYLGYVSRLEQTLVNMRLYLPEDWATDQRRRKKCGVPTKIRFRTRHELALEMLDEQGGLLPHAWIAGDDEMGRSTKFRRKLAARNERYLLAVPSNTTIRDLCAPVPEGKRVRPFEQVRAWAAALPDEAWTRVDVRDAHHGPLVAELATTRVEAKTDRKRIGPEEVLVVMRVKEASGGAEIRLSPVERCGGHADRRIRARRQSRAPHRRVHSTWQERGRAGRLRSSLLGGLAPSPSSLPRRNLVPGARSQTGKKSTPAMTVPQVRSILASMIQRCLGSDDSEKVTGNCERRMTRTAMARWYRWKSQKLLPPLHLNQRR